MRLPPLIVTSLLAFVLAPTLWPLTWVGSGVPSSEGKAVNRSIAQSSDDSMFPVAVWYGGGKARAPMLERVDSTSAERWGRDLDAIKSVGFNTVKCWVDWATAEPKPGEYDFRNLDLLMKLAEERGLRVIVQIYLDSAPDWVGEHYPDGRFVDRSGAVITSEAAPGYCIDHDGVHAEVVKFLAALSRQANRSPALYGWDVWSEPHVINWAEFPYLTNPEFCFCHSSVARFREWLRAKYKTLEALNAAWYRQFERWDQVEPPRASSILSFTDYLDWRAFIADKLAGDLKTRVEAIRSADSAHPITSHAAVPGLFTSPTDGYGEPDDFKMASSADFFGTSLYPKHSESTRPWSYAMLAAGLDFTRSAGHSQGKGFWIGELQAGQGATGMRIAGLVDSHDEENWMWQVVSHGAREIAIYAWYPMSSGYESNGYGLINLDGSLTPRARAAGQVARTIEENAREILAAEPARAEVAILYNRLAYMVGGAERSLSTLGNAERDSLEGLHRAFSDEHIPVDFVSTDDVAQDRLGQYKILYLPFPVMLAKDVADGVERFVRNGGTAVAEARLAWNDERGFASDVIPGHGLDKVFGAHEREIRPSDITPITLSPDVKLPGVESVEHIEGEAFEERLVPAAGGRILGRFHDGEPAIVENDYGKGKAVLIGSFPTLAFERRDEHPTGSFFVGLARAAGVQQEVNVEAVSTRPSKQKKVPAPSGEATATEPSFPLGRLVEVRRLVGDGYQLAFIFNHYPHAVHTKITLHLPWPQAQARDVVNAAEVPITSVDGSAVIEKELAEKEVVVLRLTPR